MEFINQYLDIYAVIATVITTILAVAVPFLASKCKKLTAVLAKVKEFCALAGKSYEDKKITKEELMELIEKINEVVDTIKG